jgi:hypothetical protein
VPAVPPTNRIGPISTPSKTLVMHARRLISDFSSHTRKPTMFRTSNQGGYEAKVALVLYPSAPLMFRRFGVAGRNY